MYFASFAAVFSGILLAIYGCLYRGAPTFIALEGTLLATIGVWLALLYTHNLNPRAKWHDVIKAPGLKAQSAMEYLMTYGWAILIIAVVLGALFSLGVFNSATFATRAYPNQCRVFRPYGQSVATGEQLEGICNNEIPQSVAQFNGASSVITIPTTTFSTLSNSYTFTAWVDPTGPSTGGHPSSVIGVGYILTGISYSGSGSSGGVACWLFGAATGAAQEAIPLNTWSFVACTYAGQGSSTRSIYINGNYRATDTTGSAGTATGIIYINGNTNFYFPGSIADVQVYNTALSANDVQALYQEGIGGEPILSDGLVGWWALNGNANDTSGNLNNGQAYGVGYTSFWTNGYASP
ncbi:MAG: LamG domain-containing protein [Candidatus Micrarchaeaceae archaeon]